MNTFGIRTPLTVAIAVAATTAIAACSKSKEYADTTAARRDSAGGAMVNRADSMHPDTLHRDSANVARGGWTEGSIVGYTVAADTGEIALGRLAEKKATNPAVKAFAREMVTDHTAMLKADHALHGKLKATLDTAADPVRDISNGARDAIKDLTEKKAGADWDKDYIDKMIDDHQKVLDKLQDAAKNTSNTDVRSALEKATGKVQEHLTKAQSIKANNLKS
jgi:putative membrane protein